MNYDEFKQFILEYMEQLAGDEFEISIESVMKNNNTALDGLCARKDGLTVSPIIYLAPFYDRYSHGVSLSNLTAEITRIFSRGTRQIPFPNLPFHNYELISPKIIFRLINYKENEELLQSVPHRQFLDLAIIYCILVDCSEDGIASAIIYHRHLPMWDKTEEDLYQTALVNTPRLLPYRFRPLEDVIFELYQEADDTIFEDLPMPDMVLDSQSLPMYVLSNSCNLHGAGCLLYPHLMENIAEQFASDYFVLPSSIHELIFVPSTPTLTAFSLQEMVLSVNHNQLPPADILSDSVYLYQSKHHRLDII